MNDIMGSYSSPEKPWYIVDNAGDVPSPALLVFPDRIEGNIRKMISYMANTGMLRPHVKTHKIPEIIRLQMKYGISKFKCATIAEAEMVAGCGATDVLLAMQPVGPNIERFFRLKFLFPGTKFSCIADSEEVVIQISEEAGRKGLVANIRLDLNVGMNRTGIPPGKEALKLYNLIFNQPGLKAEGLHVYDGHIHEKSYTERKRVCDEAFRPVTELCEELRRMTGLPVSVVAGGTPTFPVHAKRNDVETSPGTLLLWDYGYSSAFKDLDFLHAAVLMTRVVSKPARDIICLDLGHKAVASEMPQPRIKLMGLDNYDIVGHNEEHMVVRTENAGQFNTGDVLYGIPYHICPTVDRYDTVTVILEGKASAEWKVEARKRKITV